MPDRQFPMQLSHLIIGERGWQGEQPAGHIPWRVAERIAAYYHCLYGFQQSTERLAERAGFAWNAAAYIIREHEQRRPLSCRH